MFVPPRRRADSRTPERAGRGLRAIAVAVGVAIFIAALSGMAGHRRLIFDLTSLIPLVVIFFVLWHIIGRYRRSRLSENAVPATARIVELRDTLANVWDRRIVLLVLEVMPVGQPGHTARTRALIRHSELKHYVPGTMVAVRYDPAHPERVELTGLAEPARPAAAPSPRPPGPESDEVAAAEAVNQQLKTRGALARATLLEVRETGLKRDGSPFLKFRLEVRPIGGDPFTAEAAAVVRAAALSAYEPGAEVWVKHDPKQPGRVALYNV